MMADDDAHDFLIDDDFLDVVLTEEEQHLVNDNTCVDCLTFGTDNSNSSSHQSHPPRCGDTGKHSVLLPAFSNLMGRPVSRWNDWPCAFYRGFKISQYLVRPNKFLSANVHGKPYSALDMDDIFHQIHEHQFVQSWSDVESSFAPLLRIFNLKECDSLADNLLNQPEKARDLLYKLGTMVSQLCKYDLTLPLGRLQAFFMKLEAAVAQESIPEKLTVLYVGILLRLFQKATSMMRFDLGIEQAVELSLNLEVPLKKPMSLKADFCVFCYLPAILVGEVKKFRENTSDREGASKVLQDTIKDEPKPSVFCTRKRSYDSDLLQGGDEVVTPPSKKAKALNANEENENLPSSNAGNERNLTIGKSTCGDASERDFKQCGYRSLKNEEKFQVNHYLPQLLAGMLAALQEDQQAGTKRSALPNSQLGFAVEGFKTWKHAQQLSW